MSAGSEQKELNSAAFNPVDQKPVRFYMALAKPIIIPGKTMIAVFFCKRFP